MVLVDNSVLLDVLTDDAVWGNWSRSALERCANEGEVAIHPIIYAEVSIRFETIEELDDALAESSLRRLDLPWEAGFLAGKSFVRYRRGGGTRRAPLPDFYIGAHASVSGFTLLTRDASSLRGHFPTLRVIAP